ncbi:MAG: DNA/RNA nuclease SfsA [Acidobacteriota bacterium]
MTAPGPLLAARFIQRPNRFLVEARLMASGLKVTAHLADPGRLGELLLEGAELRLRPVKAGAMRKTRFSAALVRSPHEPYPWVSLDTTLPNRLAADLIEAGRLPGVGSGWSVKREVRFGSSRFDLQLTRRCHPSLIIEVKSVTLVSRGLALFPDAPTLRGTRHLRGLIRLLENGFQTMVLFVVQRHDAVSVEANRVKDPAFAGVLEEAAAAGVRLRAVKYRLDASGRAFFQGSLPVRSHSSGHPPVP